MARGWESKSIEDQKLDAEMKPNQDGSNRRLSAQEVATLHRRNMLDMNRARVADELARCANPRFRAQLESELAFLDGELKKLDV
ncbi:MAG: hypothetical protein HY821_15895 [Acidobacteria bacterium]|nr:hypothetical protein [Acidobacteriota bacterium]